MDLIDTVLHKDKKDELANVLIPWVPPTLICIPFFNTMNNSSGGGDGDAALAS